MISRSSVVVIVVAWDNPVSRSHPVETPKIYRVIFYEQPSMHKLDRYLRSVVENMGRGAQLLIGNERSLKSSVVVVVQKREVCHPHAFSYWVVMGFTWLFV